MVLYTDQHHEIQLYTISCQLAALQQLLLQQHSHGGACLAAKAGQEWGHANKGTGQCACTRDAGCASLKPCIKPLSQHLLSD